MILTLPDKSPASVSVLAVVHEAAVPAVAALLIVAVKVTFWSPLIVALPVKSPASVRVLAVVHEPAVVAVDELPVRFPTMLQGDDILYYFPRISYVNSLFLDGVKYDTMNERYSVFVLPIEGGKDDC